MKALTGRRLANSLFGTALALLAAAPPAAVAVTASPATASPPVMVEQGDAVASAGRLVLEPTERGYLGSMPVTVRNQGEETGSFRLLFREPVAGSFRYQTEPDQFCQTDTSYREHRKTYECGLQPIEPGATLTVRIYFRVRTTTQDYAMSATGGRIAISDGWQYDAPFSDFSDFGALLRSTTGSLGNPHAYVQDQVAESSIATAGEVTMIRQPDGWYEGRLRATVRYDSDAAHEALQIDTVVPDDRAIFIATDPADDACWRSCWAPGGAFMEGEERTFDLIFEAPLDAPPGVFEATAALSARWRGIAVDEMDPANNVVSFQIRIPEAA